jgi:hypothetical protein
MTPVATCPAELLYWGHIPKTSVVGDALSFRFERVLPLSIEQIHVTRALLPDGSALVAGIELDKFRAYLASRADITPATWELYPDKIPPHLQQLTDADGALAKLNLLHGPFEPAPRLLLRQITAWCIHVGLALIIILAIIGVERRVDQTRQLSSAQRALNQQAIQAIVVNENAAIKPDVALTLELRRLEQAAQDPTNTTGDMGIALEHIWRAWPQDIRAQIELVHANKERFVIRGRVPTLSDAERIAHAYQRIDVPFHRFRVEPMQAQQDGQGASFLLTISHQFDGVGQP